MFYAGWEGLARIGIVGACAYAALIVLLRIAGKRTLSKMNAFDFVVTVALGSTLATVLVSKDVPLAEGVLAFALLIVLQFVVTWWSVRSEAVQRLVKAEPRLLFFDGRFLPEALRHERITQAEVESAVRQSGFGSTHQVSAIVLETDGTMSVIEKDPATMNVLDGVHGPTPSGRSNSETSRAA